MTSHGILGSIHCMLNLKPFESFLKFKLLAENQFSSTIKQLQSDGGGKYISLQFQSFLAKNWIIQ
jgi:hypothetical protein